MGQPFGSNLIVALYEETAYGQNPGTPSGKKLPVRSFGVKAAQGLDDNNTLGRTRVKPGRGNVDVAGPIGTDLYPGAFSTLLKHALGQVSTSGAGPYTHTLTLGSLPVGLLLEKDHGSQIADASRYEYFNGCRIASLKLGFPQQGWPTADFAIKGAKQTLAASPLDATLDDLGHSPFHSFEASIQEGGSACAIATSVDLNIDNGLDESVYAIGSQNRRALHEGFATVSGTLTALFEDMALLNKAINGTESSLKITLSRGTGLGSSGNESMEFLVQQLLYERTSPPVEGPHGLLVTLPFKAYRVGANNGLQATIKNALATI